MISKMANLTRRFIGRNNALDEDKIEALGEGTHDAPPVNHLDVVNYSPSSPSTVLKYQKQCPAKQQHSGINASPFIHSQHLPQIVPLSYHSVHTSPHTSSSCLHRAVSTPLAQLYSTEIEIRDSNNSRAEVPQDNKLGTSTVIECPDLCSLNNKAMMLQYSHSEVAKSDKSLENGQHYTKINEHWTKNLRKRKKNLGWAYTSQNGKDIKAKIYKPILQCCSFKCFQNFSSDCQKHIFSKFWNMGDWNKQTKFLWDYINIEKAARQKANSASRRVHTRQFYLPNLQSDKSKVCKKMFLAVLQISNGRLNYALNQKLVARPSELPKDKRGLNTPTNKTSEAAMNVAKMYIHSLPHNEVYQEKKAKSSVLLGVTTKKTYAVYTKFCVEAGKPIVSIKVFRKLLPTSRRKITINESLVPKQANEAGNSQYAVEVENTQFEESYKLSEKNTVLSYKDMQTETTTCFEMIRRQTSSQVTDSASSNTHHAKVPQHADNHLEGRKQEGKLSIRKIRKQLRNEGKSYVAQSGKIVWGKEFLPQYTCCISKCHLLIPVEQQEILFRQYWSLGTWNLQTEFLWNHIEVNDTKTKTSLKSESRRIHTRTFLLPNFKGERKKVCKGLFCSTLQVSNGRLSRAISQKGINPANVPQDKRGKTSLHTTSREDSAFMKSQIKQLVQQQEGHSVISRSYKSLLGMTVKNAHETYSNSCIQTGRKSLCYTVFCQAVHKELEVSASRSCSSSCLQ
nr:uncharacterized protein LOC123773313 isoform X1 [Procambarus clarkii]XP_045622879.1 uncharacterized protein LOC123773313 isoform X1 [Procambarus clarkii]